MVFIDRDRSILKHIVSGISIGLFISFLITIAAFMAVFDNLFFIFIFSILISGSLCFGIAWLLIWSSESD